MTAICDARNAVLARDDFRCLAPVLDANAGPCYDAWGQPWSLFSTLEVDRVPPEPGSRKVRHTDPSGMALLCPGHHRGTGPNAGRAWALANRPLLRKYLVRVSEVTAG